MTNNTPNISDILGFLTNLLSRGWLALQACKRLGIAYKNKEINCAWYFFYATYQSCMESAVLTLSKIIIQNNDSITIYYLLNMVQNNTRQFSKESKTDILKVVMRSKSYCHYYFR